MTEYIEREAVLALAEDYEEVIDDGADEIFFEYIPVDKVRFLHAADVRPVVMCCDCKHFQVNISPSGYLPQGVPEWECRHWLRPTDPTDFCSYGEKREES